ncbi:mitochondrial dicarboxylate carrier-like [Teleopsis dalmanni]|uniref:mitochondrial dicarboxylate carrier-like n=1 Tax=Teleopsis dalmanni TaxID=139649 RepID=UPI000D3295B3|nr:mitochondrial dicarboxylate carrier-like [Teleopsis dalmanni]
MITIMPKTVTQNEARRNRWFFGGISSAAATFFTHPLDLLKVHLQTHEKKMSFKRAVFGVYNSHGMLAFYNGISASLTRQLTYTTIRIGIYEVGKPHINLQNFSSKIGLAAIAGAMGGFIGVPTDMVNIRMQHDMKLPVDKRRNYNHVFDGMLRIYKEEGLSRLFTGSSLAIVRAMVMTIGQLAVYDQAKIFLLSSTNLREGVPLHFLSSVTAATAATTLTQPIDLVKTRAMNAKPGDYESLSHIAAGIGKLGPYGFFKGFLPAFVRVGPHTILMFLIMEQLRLHFGIIEQPA